MWRFNLIYGALFFLTMSGCSAKSSSGLKAEHYVIVVDNDDKNEWGSYLFRHLSKRVSDTTIVSRSADSIFSADINRKIIRFSENPVMVNDYCIKHYETELTISVKNKEVGVWLCYQLISGILEEDSRFYTSDLLPPIIDFSGQCRDFDFEYREPHFLPNFQEDYAAVNGNHNVENAWGLWGHNLPKIVNATSKNIYALNNGERDNEQFCFSSSELLTQVANYILESFGEKNTETTRFMIMPNDNDIVCQCQKCQEAGNTISNATPAVSVFISKLAKRFPSYTIFTSAYRTTFSEPQQLLPKNTAVLFSTMNLPKGVKLNEDHKIVKQFVEQLEAWKTKTNTIYVWDYASNFDDYLTPLPILKGLQHQFRFFKKHGINGVFLNGSGYDYTPFGDVQTYIVGALMKDAEVNIDKLSRSFFRSKYPISAEVLSSYYTVLEEKYQAKNKPYNMYGSMKENLKTYTDVETFSTFYEQFPNLIAKAEGDEQYNLKKMYVALSFSRLQIAHTKGSEDFGYLEKEGKTLRIKPEISDWLRTLELYSAYQDMKTYKEVGGELQNYIAQWQEIIAANSIKNQLLDVPIKLLSQPDEGFEKTNALNDGVTGFSGDYHSGWYISSTDDLYVSFSAEQLYNCDTVRLRFLEMKKHGFTAPEKIDILVDGRVLKTLTEMEYNNDNSIATFSTEASFKEVQNVVLKCYRKKQAKSKIACDEIQIF